MRCVNTGKLALPLALDCINEKGRWRGSGFHPTPLQGYFCYKSKWGVSFCHTRLSFSSIAEASGNDSTFVKATLVTRVKSASCKAFQLK